MPDWGTQAISQAFKTSHSHPPPHPRPLQNHPPHPLNRLHPLILTSRRISGLQETTAACKAINPNLHIEIIGSDTTSAESISSLAEKITSIFGRLDIVVVNSGSSGGPVVTDITQTDPTHIPQRYECELHRNVLLRQIYLIPLLLLPSSSPSQQEQENDLDSNKHQTQNEAAKKSFIMTSSLATLLLRGPIANTQYCVSKCAQLKLLEHIHEQFFPRGINCFAVHPGAVLSEMADETTPDEFRPYLTDSPDLCGAFFVWLSSQKGQGRDKGWLSGRLVNAKWDVDELEGMKEEIVEKDALKLRLSLP
ncbi:putative NAD(P)-binding domain superfamily [Septoria linicola]|nr:putative NAD(P)-binding domain superfamily [Septoria linicola]